ncbi:predicted protein [Plenodomus lingam JN3]|uniref:TNFR-Cys domain-containing protein n=2 Tax=Leptosphaeria maculans TaxID=5022 RepID=E5A6J2_LEPMJ|nr:predicted protein [Plenodomus lingam JN3]CBX99237.1 predicted protein [Plenodomus lingam JN3]
MFLTHLVLPLGLFLHGALARDVNEALPLKPGSFPASTLEKRDRDSDSQCKAESKDSCQYRVKSSTCFPHGQIVSICRGCFPVKSIEIPIGDQRCPDIRRCLACRKKNAWNEEVMDTMCVPSGRTISWDGSKVDGQESCSQQISLKLDHETDLFLVVNIVNDANAPTAARKLRLYTQPVRIQACMYTYPKDGQLHGTSAVRLS